MKDKVVLITGGTGGVGKQTAIGLAKMGAQIIVNGRDQARGEQAVRDIREASDNPRVDLLIADVAEQTDIRKMADELRARYPGSMYSSIMRD